MIEQNIRAVRHMHTPPINRRYAERALRIARVAGRITQRYFRTALKVVHKKDGSPVTVADRETERALRRAINRHFPSHAVVGEEYGGTPPATGHCWYIDPIDGTQSFIHGIPLYTLLVALFDGPHPILGLIHNPVLHETAIAITGAGCLYNGLPSLLSPCSALAEARLQFSDGSVIEKSAPSLLSKLMARTSLARTWCDGYGYLMLISGRAEIVIDSGMQPWDIAPLYPAVLEAGGHISDLEGAYNPLAHGGAGCLACSPSLAPEILHLLS